MRLLGYLLLVTAACVLADIAWLGLFACTVHSPVSQIVQAIGYPLRDRFIHRYLLLLPAGGLLYAVAVLAPRWVRADRRVRLKQRAPMLALGLTAALAFIEPAMELPSLIKELERGSEARGAELRDLVAAVLARASDQPDTLPDGQLLKLDPKVIREELGNRGARVPREAIANFPAWKLEPLDDIQRAAAATGSSQYFVIFDRISVSGDEAWVEFGTDVVFPPPPPGQTTLKLCCSIATDRYRRRGGVWSFAGRERETSF